MNWNQNSRNDERKEEVPPLSRIFIVCSKDLCEDDLRSPFEKYGKIEDLYMPKDRHTGNSKGVAYIKYSKTSSAAAAIQELHLQVIGNGQKAIKVMIATNKSDKNEYAKDEKHNRLFVKVPKQATESEIKQHFEEFGYVESVYVQKDRATDVSKGLAYVQFTTFVDAAKAFEECDRKYKAVFAAPKQDLKRGRDTDFHYDSFHSSNSSIRRDYNDFNPPRGDRYMQKEGMSSLITTNPQNFNTIFVTCTPDVPQKTIEKLFNIIPGMVQCQYTLDTYNGQCKAIVKYAEDKAAAYAVERLHNFEFPSGEIIRVKADDPLSKAATHLSTIVNNFKSAVDSGNPNLLQLADAIAHASTLIKAVTSGRVEQKSEGHDQNFCNVYLPPSQPMANAGSKIVQRCFIVFRPQPPPVNVLQDVFGRFGDLVDVVTYPHKTFGFARYASHRAAEEAIKTLHGATVCGVTLKVMEADERPSKESDQKDDMDIEQAEFLESDGERKRLKLQDQETN